MSVALPEIIPSNIPALPVEGALISAGAAPTSSPADDLFTGLKQWQRKVVAARLVILHEIETYHKRTGRSINKSINAFLTSIKDGGPAHLKRAVEVANHRNGESRLLSDKTIYRWFKIKEDEGNAGLIPADKEQTGADNIPFWAPGFLEVYRQPSKPSIADALRQMGNEAPPYSQVIRFMKRYSNLDMQRGRMSGSELRAIRAYTKRDFSDLLPMDIIVADGHSFKAHVAHPVHGKRFLPEVEAVICVATRCCVGWSTGLAESGQVVADGIRHAVTVSDEKPFGGLFAILYTDNGGGNRAKMNSNEVTGIVARIGGTMKFGIAGNPQGRGIIERLGKTLWIPSAKRLITYNGSDMDSGAQRRRLKIIDKDLKEKGSSNTLISWRQFIDFLADRINEYNNQPHSSLPKITDITGRKRHMTPAERWRLFVEEGWRPDTLNTDEMRDLFRPQIKCSTRRGLVTIFTNEYFSKDLEHHHGEEVYVNYDIHDWRVVWVRDSQQRLICEAAWNGNRREYYPMAVVEQCREKRKNRRLALKHEQIREIEEEAMGLIEGDMSIPVECIETEAPIAIVGAQFIAPDTEAEEGLMNQTPTTDTDEQPRTCADDDHIADAVRPLFNDEIERYEWHLRNGFKDDDDLRFKLDFEASDSYRMLYLQ